MRAIPRTGWLALGALASALLFAGLEPSATPLAGLLLVAGMIVLVGAVAVARARRAPLAVLLLGLGSVSVRIAVGAFVAGGGMLNLPLPEITGEWRATVMDVSAPQRAEQRAVLRLSPLHEATPVAGGGGTAAWHVYAWLPRHPAIIPGDVIELLGRPERPQDDGSGFADFLAGRGVEGTLRSRSMRLVAREGGLTGAVERLRWDIDAGMSRALPEPEAGLAAGILIGLRERVSRQTADDFMVTGLTHVVAISGWNIALVAGIVTGLLRSTGLPRRARSCVVIAAIAAYTLIAGAEASVIRAAVMGGVVMIAREGGRPSGAATALGLACWCLLLADPGMVRDIGLQLSLAATAGLLALGGPAERAVRRLTRGRAPGWLCETLGVSLAAQLATLPLILLHFGRLSLISPLANVLVAPVVPLAMLGAFVAMLVGPLLATSAASLLLAPVTLVAWLPLAAMVRGAQLLAGVPMASTELPSPLGLAGTAIATSLLAAALVAIRRRSGAAQAGRPHDGVDSLGSRSKATHHGQAAGRPGRLRRRAAAAGLAVVIGALGSIVVLARPAALLHVSVLDVGQGDAILLEGHEGSRLLIDGGPDPDLLVRRLDERLPLWDRRVDLALLTHPHEDHVAGLAGMIGRYRVGLIAESGMVSHGSGHTELRQAATRHGIARVRLAQGDRFQLDGASVHVIWPPRGSVPDEAPSSGRAVNDTSLVLDVRVGRQRLLLTGDLEEDMDVALVRALATDGRRWDLLKVAHHGSATATSAPFLEAVRPRLAAVSAGVGNTYGHPAPATLERLAGVGARVWRTDTQGTLAVAFDGTTGQAPRAAQRASGPGCEPDGRALGRLPPGTRPGTRPWPRPASVSCYPRSHGGAHPDGSPGPAHGPRALAAAHAARHGHRRGGLLPRPPYRLTRPPGRPTAGRDSRAPPRPRQGPAARPSAAQGGAWARGSRVPRAGWPPRAGARRGRPPGHAPHGCRRRRMDRLGAAGAAHRGLLGQALHAAGRLARPAIRALVPALPGARRPACPGPCGSTSTGAAPLRPGGPRAERARTAPLGRGCGRAGTGARREQRPWRGARGRLVDDTCAGRHRRGLPGRGATRPAVSQPDALAYFWGEDAFGIERAVRDFGVRAAPPGETMLIWRTGGEDALEGAEGSTPAARRRAVALDGIEQRIGSAPLFGAGTLVVVRQPGTLLAETAARERLIRIARSVPPGNALCFADLIGTGARGPASGGVLRDVVAETGGVVREFAVPAAGRMEGWLRERASELGVTLEPAAARLLAQRVGAHVREADVDRRHRTELANAELEKLALYRPEGTVAEADVSALVTESIPASMWAFLDALGSRTGSAAARLGDELLRHGTPTPVLVAQVHRRLRDLILVREHLDAGSRPADMVRALKVQPFRAQKLAEQARTWTAAGLDEALADLADLDLRSKGISLDGATVQMSEALDALTLQAWLAVHVAEGGAGRGTGAPSASPDPGRGACRAQPRLGSPIRRGTGSPAPG
jgi:competence protein ComEC